MSAASPWSVKGIDPKAREVAKDLARRSGMTLGEWLNTMIMEDEDDGVEPLQRRPHVSELFERRGRSRRLDDAYGGADDVLQRVAASVDAIAGRLEAAERRSTVAIQSVDQAVAGLVRRLEAQDKQVAGQARRVDDIAEELREGHRRLRRFEQEVGPRAEETFGKMETAVGALASRLYDIEERQRSAVNELRQRMDAVAETETGGQAEAAVTALAGRLYDIEERQRAGADALRQRLAAVEKVAGAGVGTELLAQVGARLDTAQAQTTEALRGLERSFAGLDQRLRAAESRVEPEGAREAARFEKLAETLSRQVDANRVEMMRRLDTAETEGRMERIERAVFSIGDQIKVSERRSAEAVEAMGREVLRIAQNLNGRVARIETGQDERIDALATELSGKVERDMGRYVQAVDQRLTRTDDQHALALEKLGGEITRISDRLADRIAQSERKSAQALEDIGRRLSDSSERVEQRYDRAAGELGERMRLSEERTARLLAEAREALEQRVQGLERPSAPEPQPASSASEARAAQPDWRAAAFPGDNFDAPADDGWSGDLADELAPGPFPTGSRADPAPVAAAAEASAVEAVVQPFAQPPVQAAEASPAPAPVQTQAEPFGSLASAGYGGADVDDALEALPPPPKPPLVADVDAFGGDPDDFSAETDFLDARALKARIGAGAAAGRAATRSTVDAARAAMSAAPAEPARAGFGLGLKRGGKSRLQERLDKQAERDGSTVRKTLLASVTGMALVAGLYATSRLAGGEGLTLAGLGEAGRGVSAPSGDGSALAAVALFPGAAGADAAALYDEAVARLDEGDPAGVAPLTRAANLGLAAAQLKLAGLYESGEAGLAVDESESRLWARRAAEGGDPRGMHAFGMYLFDGVGGPRNRPEALRWLVKAAERGLVDSQYNAARIYESGEEGIAANPTEAFKWYLIAARTGDEQARSAVDRMAPDVPAAGPQRARLAAGAFQVEPLA